MSVKTRDEGKVRVVEIDRPERRNAIDGATATQLAEVFEDFEGDDDVDVAVLTGSGETFCSGADLIAVTDEDLEHRVTLEGHSPLGPVRLRLSKPVIAAIEGYAVAGGLELAAWCDLRVAARDAILGVFCRRFGVPLVDMGTIRLPRLIGHSRAMDLILTGRGVGAEEALEMGLVNRVVEPGQTLTAAVDLAAQISALPQTCMRNDRMSAIEQWDLPEAEAIRNEIRHGLASIASGETAEGALRFQSGVGRHGEALS